MKRLIVFIFVISVFGTAYAQTNRASGPTCSCPSGWGSCSADCLFTECCICFNPATSEGGCACYWGFSSCRTAPTGVAKSTNGPLSADAKVSFAFDRFNEFLTFLASKKIDASKLIRDYQPVQSRYAGQAGKVSMQVNDYNSLLAGYTVFIESLSPELKTVVRNYIDMKEKTN